MLLRSPFHSKLGPHFELVWVPTALGSHILGEVHRTIYSSHFLFRQVNVKGSPIIKKELSYKVRLHTNITVKLTFYHLLEKVRGGEQEWLLVEKKVALIHIDKVVVFCFASFMLNHWTS